MRKSVGRKEISAYQQLELWRHNLKFWSRKKVNACGLILQIIRHKSECNFAR